jgi:hypothetical protein
MTIKHEDLDNERVDGNDVAVKRLRTMLFEAEQGKDTLDSKEIIRVEVIIFMTN